MTSASSVHEAGHSKPVLWDNKDRWGAEGAGRAGQEGGTHAPKDDSCRCMTKNITICKAIILQFK